MLIMLCDFFVLFQHDPESLLICLSDFGLVDGQLSLLKLLQLEQY